MTCRIKIGVMAIALSTLLRRAEPCQTAESAKVYSVCEVMKNLKVFGGKSIAVRGVIIGAEGSFLMGRCPTHITVKGFTWPDLIWLTFPENSERHRFAPDITAHEKVQNEIKRLHPRKSDQIILTYVGVLEVEDLVKNVQMSRTGRMVSFGFGPDNDAPAQLLVQTVRDPCVLRLKN